MMDFYGFVVQKGDPEQLAISQSVTPYEPGPHQALVDLNLEYLKYKCWK